MSIGDLHSLFVHFPIVLLTLGLFCDLLNGFGKKSALPVAHWAIIGGALLSIPALITGWEAAKILPADHPFVDQHRLLAYVTSAVALIYALFRFTTKKREIHALLYVSCSVVMVLLLAITADYGGRITHGVPLVSWW